MTEPFEAYPDEPVYIGPRFEVRRGQFLHPDTGETVTREWVRPGNVVAVLPFDGTHFWLGRQPREAVGGVQLGLCAGMIDSGETPLEAAKRELLEEFGFEPSYWNSWGSFNSSEGITDEKCHLWLATGIDRYYSAQLDRSERIDVVRVPLYALDQAIEAVSDAKAKIALLKLWQKEARKSSTRIYHKLDEVIEEAEWLSGVDGDPDKFDFGV